MFEKEIAQLESDIAYKRNDIELLNAKIAPLECQRTRLYNEIKELTNQMDSLKIQKQTRPNGKLDWNYILFEDGRVTGERFKYRDEQLQKLGLSHFYYFPETQQVQIQFGLVNGDRKTIKTAKKGLEIVLPFIKPLKEDKGWKRISIVEHTSDSYRTYLLMVSGKRARVVELHSNKKQILAKYSSLENALRCIYNNHYRELIQRDYIPESEE